MTDGQPIIASVRERRSRNALTRTVKFDENEIFFEISGPSLPPSLSLHDFAALALIFRAMRQRRSLHIAGTLSMAIVRHLEEFQEAWAAWRPESYRPVLLSADKLVEQHAAPRRTGVFAFSGGVDATYALLRHTMKNAGTRTIEPIAALMVHGFDIPLSNAEAFVTAQGAARDILDVVAVPLYAVRTNWKIEACGDWEMEFGAGLASCLHQFTGLASYGVLGADEDYAHLCLPWGSNPITNQFLTGGGFHIHTEGSGITRTKRVHLIAQSPDIARRLRVCWEGAPTGGNCGECEKCVRTKMNFMASGHRPLCFDRPPSVQSILGIKARTDVQIAYLEDIREAANENGIKGAWTGALSAAIAKNKAKKALRPLLRRR